MMKITVNVSDVKADVFIAIVLRCSRLGVLICARARRFSRVNRVNT